MGTPQFSTILCQKWKMLHKEVVKVDLALNNKRTSTTDFIKRFVVVLVPNILREVWGRCACTKGRL